LLGIGFHVGPPQLPGDEEQEHDAHRNQQLANDLHGLSQDHDAGCRLGRGDHLFLQYHAFSSKAVAVGAGVA
jgi:hypothetical protein